MHQASLQTLQLGMHDVQARSGNGLDRAYHALLQNLPQVGVGARGLVVGEGGLCERPSERVRSVAARDASLFRRLKAYRSAFNEEVRAAEYDVIAIHFALYALPLLSCLRGFPVVFHFHGPWALESQARGEPAAFVSAKYIAERAFYMRCDRFIVLSSAFAQVLNQQYGVSEDRIRIVPGGVDIDHFSVSMSREEARKQLGWPGDRPILLSVRRLDRRMGLENLVLAMKRAANVQPDVLLLIAGKGPLEAELQMRIKDQGLDKNVRLLGFLPEANLPAAYRAADLTVVPSMALEGFGLITIESLAAGTPVLVTPVGGLPEVVSKLSQDLILSGTGEANLAEGIIAALEGSIVLPTAEQCTEYVRENFDNAVMARRTRQVYEGVLE